MFEVGDRVFYGVVGVCEVEDIAAPPIKGIDGKYYYLQPVYDDKGIIYSPVDSKKVSMRTIITKEEAQTFLERARNCKSDELLNQKITPNQYDEMVKSQDTEKLMHLVRFLYDIKNERAKELRKMKSADSRMLVTARKLLYGELAVALGKDYSEMSVTEKQQALLQGVVLKESSLPKAELSFNDQEIPYYTSEGKGCRLKNGKIIVTSENAQLKLVFEGEENAETYLVAEGLDYDGLSPREMISDKKWEKMTTYEQNKLLEENGRWRYWKESQKASIQLGGRFLKKSIRIFTDKYNAYSGKHNFLCNTGYSEKGRHTITLTFENTGVYSFDSLKVYSQPMTGIDRQTRKLKEEVLTDIKTQNNEIGGKISLSDRKALVFSIPYSEGWIAYVDGEKNEIQEANTMYMALELPKGEHEIRLVYSTPYLKTGLCLTCIGVLCYIVLVLINRKKKRFQKL